MQIDTHIHLYDTRRTSVRWPEKSLGLPEHVYVPDFLSVASVSGIRRMISVECTVGGPEEVDRWTLTLTENDPAVAAVIACADMTAEDFPEVHARFSAFPKYRGIRTGAIADERLAAFDRNFACMETGRARVTELLASPAEIEKLLPVIRKHPKIRFVLNHMPGCTAGPEAQSAETLRFLAAMAAEDNVYMKVSSFISKAPRPASGDPAFYASGFNACLNAFGPDRCLFGSDWPVLTLRGSYDDAVRAITGWLEPLGKETAEKIMGGNAVLVYDVDTEDET